MFIVTEALKPLTLFLTPFHYRPSASLVRYYLLILFLLSVNALTNPSEALDPFIRPQLPHLCFLLYFLSFCAFFTSLFIALSLFFSPLPYFLWYILSFPLFLPSLVLSFSLSLPLCSRLSISVSFSLASFFSPSFLLFYLTFTFPS